MIKDLPISLIEASRQVLVEHALTKGEVHNVSNKYASEIEAHKKAANEITGHIFPEGKDRIVIPLIPTKTDTQQRVEQHLTDHGFTDHRYVNGLTNDKYGRAVSIGKALQKTGADKELINKFAQHQQTIRDNPDIHDKQVVISKHPLDVIGMSQGTSWGLRPGETCDDIHTQSCMRFGTSQHERHIPAELRNGTHVAFLTHKGDDAAKDPISRIALKPFSSKQESKYKHINLHLSNNHEIVQEGLRNGFKHGSEDMLHHIHTSIAPIFDAEFMDGEDTTHLKRIPNIYGSDTTRNHNGGYDVKLSHDEGETPVFDGSHTNHVLKHLRQAGFDTSNAFIDVSGEQKLSNVQHHVLVPGSKVYGKPSDAFASTVKDWTDKHTPLKSGDTYQLKQGSYSDGDPTTIVSNKLSLKDRIDNLNNADEDEIYGGVLNYRDVFNHPEFNTNHVQHILDNGKFHILIELPLSKNALRHVTPKQFDHMRASDVGGFIHDSGLDKEYNQGILSKYIAANYKDIAQNTTHGFRELGILMPTREHAEYAASIHPSKASEIMSGYNQAELARL